MKNKKEISRLKRHTRLRLKMNSSADRPRLVVRRSLNNLSAQIVDDTNNTTMFSISSMDKEVKEKFPSGGNIKAAVGLGEICVKKLKEKGINKIIFDRAGYLYHGRVKAFAESLRKGGLEF